MALTKVQTIGIETGISLTGVTTVTTLNASTDTLSVGGTVNFGGNVSIAGTLTYEDVTNIDSVGLITARNGIKVDDLGVQVGTGATVDSAGDNILTFLTNGSERVRIDSSGNFGLGTSSPSFDLEVKNSSGDCVVALNSPNSSNTEILFGDPDSSYSGRVRYGNSTNHLQFNTNASERMRIDSSGRLLLGTTTEGDVNADNLTIVDSGNCGMTIRSGTSSSGAIFFSDGTSGDAEYRGQIYYDHNGDYMRFSIAASEAMRIDSLGRLAVATTAQGESSADNLTLADSGNCGLTIRSGTSNGGSIYFSDATSGAAQYDGYISYNHPNQFLVFGTGSSERMRIDSSGQMGLGTASPDGTLHVHNGTAGSVTANGNADELIVESSGTGGISILTPDANHSYLIFGSPTSNEGAILRYRDSDNLFTIGTEDSNGALAFRSGAGSEAMRIDSSGRVLIGTTTEGRATATDNLTIADSADCGITIRSGTSNDGAIDFSDGTSGAAEYSGQILYDHDSNFMRFMTSATEQVRIDSVGRLMVGATSGDGKFVVRQAQNTTTAGTFTNPHLKLNCLNTTDNNGFTGIAYAVSTVNNYGWTVGVQRISTSGTDGAFVFRHHNNSATGNERMRITSGGFIQAGTTEEHIFAASINNASASSLFAEQRNGSGNGACAKFNRSGSDGNLINFQQAGTTEGTITVSGSTVSYNGGHLSRWSQLAGGAERTEILRGTVLSNLDEMCVWAYEAQDAVLYTEEDELPEGVSVGDVKTPAVAAGTEDNEQLNRMKVSDIEGDANVAGVFQSWDDGDETYTNDFYCAMTGDFVIRIAQGTTVARGDLLMSAGDGTAKPQDDDIVRSKTIAKVTSTTVSTTYSDGSYCVPCVLMAC